VEEADYLVILEKRPGCWYLWTTYYTDHERTRSKFRAEYESYIKSQRRP
jgi:acyl-coenzyme A synthetase/AMP-(fatty) acid ligase